MPHPCPHHCPPSGGSGPGLAVAVVLGVLVAAAAAAPAVTAAVHVAEIVLQVVLITVACVLGLAALAGMAWAALRVYRWRANRAAATVHPPLRQRAAQSLPAAQARAIDPPRQAITGPATVNRARAPRVPHP